MTARSTTLIAVVLALGLSAPAVAEDEPESRFSGIFQLDTTNAYFFRGIKQEREGIIFEPWTELYYSLYSSEDGFLRDVTIGGGMWMSWHSKRTLADQDPQWLYETDYYPLISLGFAEGVTLTTTYYFYTSPNGAFTTAQELNFKLAWDDSEALGAWSMQPWINVAIEVENTAFGPDEGTGIQAGVAPTLYAAENESFTLTAPVEVGLSAEDYYEGSDGKNHEFGYASAGLAASIPLTFVPEGAGSWSLGLAAKYYAFNDILDKANHDRSTYPVGTLSLSVEF
jgi:hypothetical protein